MMGESSQKSYRVRDMSKKRKKLVIISDFPLRGSSFGVVTNNMIQMLSNDYEITVLAMQYSGIPITVNNSKIMGLSGVNQLAFYNEHLKRDITLIFHSFYFLENLGSNPITGRKILYIPVEVDRLPSRLSQLLYNYDRIITPSKFSAKTLERVGIKADVVYHGVDAEAFKCRDIPKTHMFGFLALNDLRKAIPRLFEAYSRFKKQPGLLLGIKLEGGHYNITEMTKDLKIQPNYLRTKAIGLSMTTKQIAGFYNRIKVNLLCSNESFGLTSLEAASTSLANLASEAGASKEILGDSSLYIRCSSTLETNLGRIRLVNIDDFEKKLRRLNYNVKLREKLGQRGRKRALKFTWKKSMESLKKVIEEELEYGR